MIRFSLGSRAGRGRYIRLNTATADTCPHPASVMRVADSCREQPSARCKSSIRSNADGFFTLRVRRKAPSSLALDSQPPGISLTKNLHCSSARAIHCCMFFMQTDIHTFSARRRIKLAPLGASPWLLRRGHQTLVLCHADKLGAHPEFLAAVDRRIF